MLVVIGVVMDNKNTDSERVAPVLIAGLVRTRCVFFCDSNDCIGKVGKFGNERMYWEFSGCLDLISFFLICGSIIIFTYI